jgi:hypothetical protein
MALGTSRWLTRTAEAPYTTGGVLGITSRSAVIGKRGEARTIAEVTPP